MNVEHYRKLGDEITDTEDPLIFPSKTKMRLRRVRYDEIVGVLIKYVGKLCRIMRGETHEVGAESFLDKKYFESSVTMMRFGALGRDILGSLIRSSFSPVPRLDTESVESSKHR